MSIQRTLLSLKKEIYKGRKELFKHFVCYKKAHTRNYIQRNQFYSQIDYHVILIAGTNNELMNIHSSHAYGCSSTKSK